MLGPGSVEHSPRSPTADIRRAIRTEFDLDIPVLVRSRTQIQQLVGAVPSDWTNGEHMKCDVMFLWNEVDHPDIAERVNARHGIDHVTYLPGALVWKVDRGDLTRSRMPKLVGTKLYRSMTVRNINTVRKLGELMDQI